MVKVKVSELRTKTKKDLQKQIEDSRGELAQLRVAQVTQGQASKLGRINLVRKTIARALTVLNQKTKAELRKQVAGAPRKPKQLRFKKTRAMRRALKPSEAGAKTLRQLKKEQNLGARRYAVRA